MTTTQLVVPPTAPDEGELGAFTAVVGVVPVAGPPAVLVGGPLVLFALLLTGPFVVILTVVVLLVACGALVTLAGAIVVSPYVLVRHFGRHELPRAQRHTPGARLVEADSRRGLA